MMIDWRHLPSLATLRAFHATAQHGGFTGAGRALNVTHAAIAQQVRALERELGLPLVQRLGRAVSLTPQGEQLAQSLSDGFTTIAAGIAALQRREDQRVLRVATTAFIAQSLILPRLAEFWTQHPGVEVAMTPGFRTVDLLAEGYDLAIRGWRTEGPGIQTEHLAETRWVLAGAPALLGEGPVDPMALPWIIPDETIIGFLQRAGIDTDRITQVRVGSPFLEMSAALLGLGLVVATEAIIRDDLASGKLREVPLTGLPPTHYYATMPAGPRRAATQAFIDWVRTLI